MQIQNKTPNSQLQSKISTVTNKVEKRSKNVNVIKKEVVIIGAGASGLFAGYCLAKNTKDFIIVDHMNKPGKKLLLCGGGQCNLTHDGSIKDFISMYFDKGKSIRKILYKYSNKLMIDEFQRNGLPLTCRSDGKIFPKSMCSIDVVNFLVTNIKKGGGNFLFREKLSKIETKSYLAEEAEENKPHDNLNDLHHNLKENFRHRLIFQSGTQIYCNFIILACGGRTFPSTGSDASIVKVLSTFKNIKFTNCNQGLSPIYTKNFPFKDLAGVVIDPVTCQILDETGKLLCTETGPLLFNGRGFSGPSILHISRFAKDGYTLKLNYLNVKDSSSWAKGNIIKMNNSPKSLSTYAHDNYKLPRSFLKVMEKLFPTPSKFANNLVNHQLTITDADNFKTGMVTCGGIDLSCLNLTTMELKDLNSIYAIGELVDIDGKSGGYNLQWAFSSGFAAATDINATLDKRKEKRKQKI